MGEVYRARDSKLKRDVAVKVLPQSLAADPDALARFEREALAVAALSHPNILSIFDFGTQDGIAYAVTELLEGETLRGKLDTGRDRAEAGDRLTRCRSRRVSPPRTSKGVVHRDLKPENVFVSKDGHVEDPRLRSGEAAWRRSLRRRRRARRPARATRSPGR